MGARCPKVCGVSLTLLLDMFREGTVGLNLRSTGNCFQRGPHNSTKMVALADHEVSEGRGFSQFG